MNNVTFSEISNYIIENFKKITGSNIAILFNKDSGDIYDPTPIINQDGVEATSDKIKEVLEKKFKLNRRELDDFFNFFDEELCQYGINHKLTMGA